MPAAASRRTGRTGGTARSFGSRRRSSPAARRAARSRIPSGRSSPAACVNAHSLSKPAAARAATEFVDQRRPTPSAAGLARSTTSERTSATARLSGASSAQATTAAPSLTTTNRCACTAISCRVARQQVAFGEVRRDQAVNVADVGRRRGRTATTSVERSAAAPRGAGVTSAVERRCRPSGAAASTITAALRARRLMRAPRHRQPPAPRRGCRRPRSISAASIVSGGSMRTTFSLVRLTSSPLLRAPGRSTGGGVDRSSRPHISPAPRTSTMTGCFSASVAQPALEVRADRLDVLEQAAVHQLLEEERRGAARPAGCRRRCCRDRRPRSSRRRVRRPARRRSARREPSALPTEIRSGCQPSAWKWNGTPVRPSPVCTSSAMSSVPVLRQTSAIACGELRRQRTDAAFTLDRLGDDRRRALGDGREQRLGLRRIDERHRLEQRLERRAVVLVVRHRQRAHASGRRSRHRTATKPVRFVTPCVCQ